MCLSEREPKILVLPWGQARKAMVRYTNNHKGNAVKLYGFSNRGGVASEGGLPICIIENKDGIRSRLLIGRLERSPHRRNNSKSLEEITGNELCMDQACRAIAAQSELCRTRKCSHTSEYVILFAHTLKHRIGERATSERLRAGPPFAIAKTADSDDVGLPMR